MNDIFNGATSFDQAIGVWNLDGVTTLSRILSNSGLSVDNYDSTLIGWHSQGVPNNLNLGATGLNYCESDAARQSLIDDAGWTISDGIRVCEGEDFVTVWQTTIADESISIPFTGGNSNIFIDWGDGQYSYSTFSNDHTYALPGEHTVRIFGNFSSLQVGSSNALKLLRIEQWGSNEWSRMSSAFRNAENMTVVATDAPDLTNVTSMRSMFEGCKIFNTDINDWDVSNVTDMSFMFGGVFNQDISNWDVGSVTDMSSMFAQTDAFNQDIGNWDVSSVTNMGSMFSRASVFNQDIGDWDVSNVTDMPFMFRNATSFNQDLRDWPTDQVTECRDFDEDSALSPQNLPTRGACF